MSEKVEQEIINESLVIITQNAVVDYSGIPRIIKSVERRIFDLDLDNIEATDENKSKLKNLRTELNKDLKEYEDARKEIKKTISNPYDEFEKSYKPLKDLLDKASNDIKVKIDEVEDRQREIKRNNLEIYFNEKKVLVNEELKPIGMDLKFVSFNHINLNITISATEISLVKQIDDTLERFKNDLLVISGNPHKTRLYAKYSTNLDLSGSLIALQNELQLEEQMINNVKPKVEEIKVVEPKINAVEEIFEMVFEVEGTKLDIKKVRDFMIENKIKYEMKTKKGEK